MKRHSEASLEDESEECEAEEDHSLSPESRLASTPREIDLSDRILTPEAVRNVTAAFQWAEESRRDAHRE